MRTMLHSVLVLFLATPPAWAADAIAFISDLKGEVSVDGMARPMLLSELSRGQKVAVGRDSVATVMYTATGKEYILKGPGEYLVKDTEIAGAIFPPVARSTEWRANSRVLAQVAQTSAASVRMRSVAQPRADVAKPSFPSEGSVATLQPVFRWQAGEPAEFTLRVVGQDKPVHVARVVAGSSYRLPAGLRPETEYAWVAVVAGGEVGSGRFRTLPARALAHVEQNRPSERAEFTDRLMFTLLLHEVGATQEARESWARLSQERADLPELSALAR